MKIFSSYLKIFHINKQFLRIIFPTDNSMIKAVSELFMQQVFVDY